MKGTAAAASFAVYASAPYCQVPRWGLSAITKPSPGQAQLAAQIVVVAVEAVGHHRAEHHTGLLRLGHQFGGDLQLGAKRGIVTGLGEWAAGVYGQACSG